MKQFMPALHKLLGLCLIACLLLGILPLSSTAATAGGTNLIADGGFDSQKDVLDATSSSANPSTDSAHWYSRTANKDTIITEGTNKYLKLSDRAGMAFSPALTESKAYKITFKIKLTAENSAPDTLRPRVAKGTDYTDYVEPYLNADLTGDKYLENFSSVTATDWTEFTFYYKCSDVTRNCLLFVVTGGSIYIDDVTVTEYVPVVVNGGMITDGKFDYQKDTLDASSASANPSTDNMAWFTALAGDGTIQTDGTNKYLQLTKSSENPRTAVRFNAALNENKIYKITFKLKLVDAGTKPSYLWTRVIKAGHFTSTSAYKEAHVNSDGATGDGYLEDAELNTVTATEWSTFSVYYKATDITYDTLLLVANNSICIDDVMVTEYDPAEESGITTAKDNKVAIRTADNADGGIAKQGMRVYNSIDKAWADNNATEYGSIAIREGYLTTLQSVLSTTEGLSLALYDRYAAKYDGAPGFGKGISYNGTDRTTWETTDTAYVFTAYLTGIEPKHYGDVYLIRSYVKDTNGNVYYGEIYEQSVYNVVQTIQTDYSDDTVGVAAANAIIAEAEAADDVDSSIMTYQEWLDK